MNAELLNLIGLNWGIGAIITGDMNGICFGKSSMNERNIDLCGSNIVTSESSNNFYSSRSFVSLFITFNLLILVSQPKRKEIFNSLPYCNN